GEYSLTDSSDIKISAANVDLLTYQKLLNPDQDTNNMLSGRVRYFDLNYKGVPASPRFDVTAVSEELSLGSTQIGRLDADVKYQNNELTPNIVFSNKNNTGKFSLTGSVPMLISLSGDELDSLERSKILAGKEANLNAIANNFQLKVFQQLIPLTAGLEGILNGRISLVGTADKPVLTGNMNVDTGRFYVPLTKMNYDFIANLSTKDEKILINNSKIFVREETSRFISASGYLDFTGFTLNDLKLVMTGDVMAFDKDNGGTELGITGDLWIGSGRNSITLQGDPDRFDLTGNLVLVKGNIVFNPFLQEAYNIYNDDFVYGVIIDSLKNSKSVSRTVSETAPMTGDSSKALIDSSKTIIVIDSAGTGRDLSDENEDVKRMILMQNPDSIVVLKDISLNPFEKIIYIYNNQQVKKVAVEKSGKFFYNLLVTTSENVFLKFIVNERSQQEFFGEIRTEDLNIYNDDDYTMQGRGTVTLGDNCYYQFFRKFDATGNVSFHGPISNPDLNITAQYKGLTTSGASTTGQENLEDVVLDMKVTGEAKNPLLTITLTRGSTRETGNNATSDAISFLLFGKFQDQLSFGESTSFGANIGASFLSNYLSSSLETIFPFLINTSFNYVDSKSGTIAQNTDVRFTASIGDAIIRFGGQIFKGIANTDIVLDYPLNKFLKIGSLSNNLIFRFERVYDPFYSDNDIANTNGTRVGGLVYYKIKF
ncbi:MAG: translocation/assembly module TamB, partial [Bacteroidota bacterium]|nr:translocation/assembly module TamB [Bacteroidota bacterium]